MVCQQYRRRKEKNYFVYWLIYVEGLFIDTAEEVWDFLYTRSGANLYPPSKASENLLRSLRDDASLKV